MVAIFIPGDDPQQRYIPLATGQHKRGRRGGQRRRNTDSRGDSTANLLLENEDPEANSIADSAGATVRPDDLSYFDGVDRRRYLAGGRHLFWFILIGSHHLLQGETASC